MQCSIEGSVAVSLPTCVDYTELRALDIRVDLITNDMQGNGHFYPRSIAEDEEMGWVHVLHTLGSKVIVLSYDGHLLFEYTLKGLNQFKPRGMCIRNNLVYITDLRYDRLYLFTTEGELVTYVQTSSSGAKRRRPRGVAADRENNVYVCFMEELQIYNCILPVHQSFGRNQIGKPKDVQLYGESILVLSWDPCATAFVLSSEGSLLSRVALGTHASNKPWYFDLDHYGNFLLVYSVDRVSVIELRSQTGELLASKQLKELERPRGIKLLKNKTMLAITSYNMNYLSMF